MGGGGSKVDPLDKAEELGRRVAKASHDRNRLTQISLNTVKLQHHTTSMHALTVKLTKETDKLVQHKASYTTVLTVKQAAMVVAQKSIDELKHAERLVVECQAALVPLQSQLRELVASYEEGLGDMKAQNASQKKGALPKAAGQSSTSPNNNPAAAQVTTEAASGEMGSGGLSLDIPAADDAAGDVDGASPEASPINTS
jgi:hypothetical protein